ncbi:MAG: hypothetical protein BRC43_17635 [Cyanobacteria bacterium QS_3_48_167]|nr:MAG: hypothetical protein BRC43_17635 [Cyanobacteria bacterium QS_3_48_167]
MRTEIKDKIVKLISDKKVFLFIGYSGSDYFDVDPFFEELANNNECNLSNKIFIWMKRPRKYPYANYLEKFDIFNQEHPKPNILKTLSRSEAQIYIWWKSNLNQAELTDSLRNYWKFPSPNDVENRQSRPVYITNYFPKLEGWKKEIITNNIWISMGIGHEALPRTEYLLQQRLREHKNQYKKYCQINNLTKDLTPGLKIYSKYIEAKREQGEYKDANNLCQKMSKFILRDFDQLFYFERLGSGYRIMMAPWKAYKEHKKGLEYGKNLIGTDEKMDELYIELVRGYIQLIRDPQKNPYLRKFAHCEQIPISI